MKKPEHTLLFALKKSSSEMYLVEALQKSPYDLLITQTGEETIRVYNDHPTIDLIIITSDLPGKDAFETVDEICKNNASVPVILLSDFVTINTIRLALGIGCSEILQTPVETITLEGILHKYLNN
jgi:DNA-binding response OmpR family regulator